MIPFLAFTVLLVIPACAGRGPESLSRIEVLERSSLRIEMDNSISATPPFMRWKAGIEFGWGW